MTTAAAQPYGLAAHAVHLRRGSRHLAVLLHGLGGDASQPLALTPDALASTRVDVLAPDARAHGRTMTVGRPEQFRSRAMAFDVLDLIDHLALSKQVLIPIGISMGAAVALELTRAAPDRVAGALLIRPAFGTHPWPAHSLPYRTIARLLRGSGADGAIEFATTAEYRAIAAISPRAAESLLGQFSKPLARERVIRLETVPANVAINWKDPIDLGRPITIVAAQNDPTHPREIAELWQSKIVGANLTAVPSRDADPTGYTEALARQVAGAVERWTERRSA